MLDTIRLLPDTIANQIAAGEVVNKPSNVVKELLENAVDAQATHLKLWIKDGGTSLIQVIDNGIGMSISDARMCFERHATSKLRTAEDLYQIRTMGFRGEALAAISAVAQVTLKTKRALDELGTLVQIEGGNFKNQEPTATTDGTNIMVKNIFFNLPARRKFLKSNITEYHHIITEFNKVALANPAITFQLYNEEQEVAHFPKCNFKQRIVQILGKNSLEQLIPVSEATNLVQISGFIGKAPLAKKNKPDQYLFVNNRYIKSGYFNKAIRMAYEGLLPEDKQPCYVIYLEIDPALVDINRNPQKNEALFIDEQEIYKFLLSAVKKSLGFHQVAPALDFDIRTPFDEELDPNYKGLITPPTVKADPNYNPFQSQKKSYSSHYPISDTLQNSRKNWETLYEIQKEIPPVQLPFEFDSQPKNDLVFENQNKFLQVHQRYLLTTVRTGIMLIDQKAAHERILFEKFCKTLENHKVVSQQSLFPQTVSLSMVNFERLQSIQTPLHNFGFELRHLGNYDMVIDAYPTEIESKNQVQVLLEILEDFELHDANTLLNLNERLAKSLAKSASISRDKVLTEEEMKNLFNQLFTCEYPNIGIFGGKIIHIMKLEELNHLFEN